MAQFWENDAVVQPSSSSNRGPQWPGQEIKLTTKDPGAEFEEIAPARPNTQSRRVTVQPIFTRPDYKGERDNARAEADEARKAAEWAATHFPDGTPISPPPAGYRYKPDRTLEAIPGGPQDTEGQKSDEDDAAVRAEAIDKIKLARSLIDRSKGGWFTTGVGSGLASYFKGSPAYDVAQDTETLKNAGALTRIMEMSAQNGGKNPLTPLSNSDFQALASSLSNLDTGQSDAQYQANVQRVIDLYERAYKGAGGTDLESDLNPQNRKGGVPVQGGGGTPANAQPPVGPGGGGDGGVPTGVTDPQMLGGLPVGSQIEWSADRAEEPFDHDRWLWETFRMTPDMEPQVTAFWNQNRGNPRLTVDAAKAWYANKGIPIPDDGGLADAVAKARAGQKFGGFDDTAAREAYTKRLRAANAAEGFDPNSLGAYADRPANGLLWGYGDELSGVGGGIDALLDNRGVQDGYRLARDRQRQAFADERDAQGYVGDALELGGGLVGGGIGASRGAMTAARAAREAAIGGAIAGFGYGEGAGDSLTGAAIGGATGAGLGYGIGRGAEALAARRATRFAAPTEGAEVIGASNRLNDRFGTSIHPLPADVGGPATQKMTASAGQLPASASRIVRAADRITSEGRAARDAIALLTGTSGTADAAGEAALAGAQKYIKSSKTKVDALYAKARRLGGDEPVDLANARRALDDHLAELSDTPGGAPGLTELQSLRSELDRSYSVEGVKRMRTALRDRFIGDGLRNSDLERRVGMVVDAADDDITTALNTAGKGEAARAYQEAAAAHKERAGLIDDVLAPFIGRNGEKSVEDVMKAIDSAAKTKGARLGKFLAALPDDDAGTVRATIISRLGRASNGRQDDAGQVFSLNDFLTHWNQMSGPAKHQLFGGEVRAALDDLAKVASGTKQGQRFANGSNTGGPVGLVVSGGVASQLLQKPIQTALFFLPQYAAGRLLSSPKIARWLAKMPSNPGLIEKHVSALTRIAANDNAIAQDVIGLKSALEEALRQGSRATAAPPTQNSQTGTGQGGRR